MNLYRVVLMDMKLEARQGEALPQGSTFIVNIMAEDMESAVNKAVREILPEHRDMRIFSVKEAVTNIR